MKTIIGCFLVGLLSAFLWMVYQARSYEGSAIREFGRQMRQVIEEFNKGYRPNEK